MTKLSVLGRLVFVILITQADDEGRQYADAHHLAKVFLGNGRLASGVQAQLELMKSSGMVVTYLDTSSRPVVALCNFSLQQKIDHPKASRIQNPPQVRESSRDGANVRESIALIRSDQIVSEGIYPPDPPRGLLSAQAIEVIRWWCQKRGWQTVPPSRQERIYSQAEAYATLGFEDVDLITVLEDGWQAAPEKPASLAYFWQPAQERAHELFKVQKPAQWVGDLIKARSVTA